ncbi:zinc-dependent metalloprotease [Mycobacterium sp. PSTR-4-N]|uniref:zinc-dependent metalloprotease n=1 Tax=Mycobacterium sp. PSTR-4-N TaxID=2917745 RepID=UPI001F14BA57|nr:zinc-dependent metalloprotease [Mycobacterium sp. PSTR-4-N]MCG7594430.1 zinc-dependent metalloprotease [Mycobacterium sp. PSTR-4-N]
MSQTFSVGSAVDWNLAASFGGKLARPEPPATDYTRRQVIAQLADAARAAEVPVREVTGLAEGADIPEARIVDRPQWIRAAAGSMRAMTGGSDGVKPRAISGRIAGVQTGAVLAFVSSGILGQYDPFAPNGGELLLVYPNVIAVERQLHVQPADFRMWVCLHEVTHRVQFRANPWLAGHMSDALGVLTSDTGEDVTQVIGRLADFVRQRRSGESAEANSAGILGLVRAVQSEAQREALDRLLVLGTLLEGHADHVMDAVGPAVVPSVATIRRRFDQRRHRRQPPVQRLLRALLGIDAKMDQYTRGKAFVDAVVSTVGMARFNTIWTGPHTLPLPDEIDEPQRWIDRVL